MYDQVWSNRPFVPLATDRLLMRPLRPSDAAQLARLLNDIKVSERLLRVPFPYTESDARDFINYASSQLKKSEGIILAILDRHTMKFMGVCGLENELGIWLGQAFWGQGYGFEAMQAIVHFGFTSLKLNVIQSAAHGNNAASIRIHQKLGFKETGSKEVVSKATGQKRPTVCFTLKQEDYFEKLYAKDVPVVWVVAAALVNAKGQLLLAQRPEGKTMAGVWELPGGKIEPGETPEAALIRELQEELGIQVMCQTLEPVTFVSYHYHSFHLVMPLYLCQTWDGDLSGCEGQALRWIKYEDISEIATPVADVSLFHDLATFLRHKSIW